MRSTPKPNSFLKLPACIAILYGAPFFANTAHAQIVDQYFPTNLPGYQSDISLPMPDYDPRVEHGRGFKIDGLTVGASASEAAGYDSAPLGAFGGASPTLVTNADVSLASDWRRDAVGAQLEVDDHRYLSTSLADYTNWSAAAGGSLDLGTSRVSVGYDHISQNLAPTELGVIGITAPVPYSDDDERLNADIPFGRIRLIPAFEHQQFSFGNLTSPIDLDYSTNNHQIWNGSLTGLFELSKGRALVAMIRGTQADYVQSVGSIRNNYSDVIGFFGLDAQLDPAFKVRALVGAQKRSFQFLPSQTSTIPTAEIDLIWQPSRLTTMLLWFSREFQDPTFPFASSEVTTSGRFEIEHSLHRNVELRAFASVGSSDYGTGVNDLAGSAARTTVTSSQLLTTLGANTQWDVNRHVALTLAYSHNINSFGGQINQFTTPFNKVQSYNSDQVTLGLRLTR